MNKQISNVLGKDITPNQLKELLPDVFERWVEADPDNEDGIDMDRCECFIIRNIAQASLLWSNDLTAYGFHVPDIDEPIVVEFSDQNGFTNMTLFYNPSLEAFEG